MWHKSQASPYSILLRLSQSKTNRKWYAIRHIEEYIYTLLLLFSKARKYLVSHHNYIREVLYNKVTWNIAKHWASVLPFASWKTYFRKFCWFWMILLPSNHMHNLVNTIRTETFKSIRIVTLPTLITWPYCVAWYTIDGTFYKKMDFTPLIYIFLCTYLMIFLIPSQRLLITINYDIMYFPIIYDSYIILLFLLRLPITVNIIL